MVAICKVVCGRAVLCSAKWDTETPGLAGADTDPPQLLKANDVESVPSVGQSGMMTLCALSHSSVSRYCARRTKGWGSDVEDASARLVASVPCMECSLDDKGLESCIAGWVVWVDSCSRVGVNACLAAGYAVIAHAGEDACGHSWVIHCPQSDGVLRWATKGRAGFACGFRDPTFCTGLFVGHFDRMTYSTAPL